MTRLTNAIKDQIIAKALEKSGADSEINAAHEKQFAWVERARIEILGGQEKSAEYAAINAKAKKDYDSLPKGLQGYDSVVQLSSYLRVNLAGANLRMKMPEYAIAPDRAFPILAGNPLCQQFYDIQSDLKAAEDKRDLVRVNVRATLDKFGTIKRLLEAWPEAKELIPAVLPEAKTYAMAVKVDDLNKIVGLPSGD